MPIRPVQKEDAEERFFKVIMMTQPDPPTSFRLEITRLLLRDFVFEDWPVIYALSCEPTVTGFQSWLRLAHEEAARHWVTEAIFHNSLLPRSSHNLAIIHKESDQVIGWLGWGKPGRPEPGDYDFGYALLPAFWNQGFMSEALSAAVNFMFCVLNAGIVFGECDKANPASARVMEKAGLRLVADWSDVDEENGGKVTMQRYAVTSTEYPAK